MYDALYRLGYDWAWRMDDDSAVHSAIGYNLFADMRSKGHFYGWRQLAYGTERCCHELQLLSNATPELLSPHASMSSQTTFNMSDDWSSRTRHGLTSGHVSARGAWVWQDYCTRHTWTNFYNNFFVTRIDWWRRSHAVRIMQRRFDDSKLIFTRRLNDLIFQSVVVLTILPAMRRRHFLDFAYDHTTVRNGTALIGGYESSYLEPNYGLDGARAFKRHWRSGLVRNCSTPETAEPGAPERRTYYVAHHSCPVCEQTRGERTMPLAERVIALPTLWDDAGGHQDTNMDTDGVG